MKMGKLLKGYTLIELLATIGIVATLSANMFPAYSRARERAKESACSSNLKQMGIAIQMYAIDYDNQIPGYRTAPSSLIRESPSILVGHGKLQPYLKDLGIFGCPDSNHHTAEDVEREWLWPESVDSAYFYRGWYGGRDEHGNIIIQPTLKQFTQNEAIVMDANSIYEGRGNHLGRVVNMLFIDGHVETIPNLEGRFIALSLMSNHIEQVFDKADAYLDYSLLFQELGEKPPIHPEPPVKPKEPPPQPPTHPKEPHAI